MSFLAGPRRELALQTVSEMIKSHFDSLQEENEKELVTPGKKARSTNGKVPVRKVNPDRKNMLISRHSQRKAKKKNLCG